MAELAEVLPDNEKMFQVYIFDINVSKYKTLVFIVCFKNV